MTKKELIRYGKDYLHDLETACCSISDIHKEFVREAIKSLEQNTVSQETYDSEYLARKQAEQELYEIQQNTSDDCVSRQAVKEGMIKYGFHAPDMTVTEFIEDELPPVTPKIPSSDDCVSLEVYKQVIWERDIAIEQLKELGYGFGEKIRTSDDFVSRADLLAQINESWETIETKIDFVNIVKALSSVTPTQCIAAIRFSKEDLKEICNERIEIACEHGTCMNCKHNRPNSYARTMFSCE